MHCLSSPPFLLLKSFPALPFLPPLLPQHLSSSQPHIAVLLALLANQTENACGFRVCINTVPGPVNLHTKPSPDAKFDMIPPEATRSRMYLQFQATRWPLSMMYFSSFWSYLNTY